MFNKFTKRVPIAKRNKDEKLALPEAYVRGAERVASYVEAGGT